MPRNVRNVWVKVECNEDNGRVVETGPRTKEGGADVSFFVRRNGETYAAGYVTARRLDERIVLTWRPEKGDDVTLYDGPRDGDGAGAVRESVDDEGPAVVVACATKGCNGSTEGEGTRDGYCRECCETLACAACGEVGGGVCPDCSDDEDPDGDFCREADEDRDENGDSYFPRVEPLCSTCKGSSGARDSGALCPECGA